MADILLADTTNRQRYRDAEEQFAKEMLAGKVSVKLLYLITSNYNVAWEVSGVVDRFCGHYITIGPERGECGLAKLNKVVERFVLNYHNKIGQTIECESFTCHLMMIDVDILERLAGIIS